ncbi:hypothetical protein AXG93_219s1010 [Marchantia polymorpha subsp. ruderalis]|uniref:Peptidase A1 domain-containing protein n=3 Tax=Marchantia polymorpha TaxID=3197 RepID=A0A176WIN4_MARPO|nr:hypothetical protein AXG93_219s1010 [Marchantia polymorpha subsp. ruderalis]
MALAAFLDLDFGREMAARSRWVEAVGKASVLLLLGLALSLAVVEAYKQHEGIARSTYIYGDRAKRGDGDGGIKLKSETLQEGMFVEMKHLDHHADSPLHQPESTFAERIQNAVKRSNKRVAGFKATVASGVTPRGVDFDPKLDVSVRAASFESPVTSSPGSYVMTISLGSPPQTKTAIVDTGSDLVWLQCSPCSVCYHQNDPFLDPSKSTTYKKVNYSSETCAELPQRSDSGGFCTYRYGYGDQSTTQGELATDTLTLTTTTGDTQEFPSFVFGCGHKNRGTFSGTDGLVGLGRGDLSFPEQIGSLIGSKFSYCLVEITSSAAESSPLIFGDAAVSVGNSLNLQYTPLIRNPAADSFYYVKLKSIKVNKQNVVGIPSGAFDLKRNGQGGVIVDSGTTLTYLIQSAYSPFLIKLRSFIKYPLVDSSQYGLDLCYDLSGVSDPQLPSVTLQFQGVDVDLPSNNVFLQIDQHGTTCLAFAGTSGLSIIGNIQQQNFYYLYDVENERVGIAPVDSCGKLSMSRSPSEAQRDEL